MTSDVDKFFPIGEIRQMWNDGLLSKGDMMDLTVHSPNLFIKLILDIPYELSQNQKWLLDTFYDPKNNFSELVLIAGRKGGKTDMASAITLFQIYKLLQIPNMRKRFGIIGNKPIYAINVAASQEQALGVTFDTIKSLTDESWYLKQYKKDERRGEITFTNNLIAHCQSCSARSIRGYACIISLLDEACHYVNTAGNLSAEEVYEANMPNLDPLLPLSKSVIISSPAGKQGKIWELFRKGKALRVLQPQPEHGEESWRMIAQFSSWELNKNPLMAFDGKKMQQELQRNPDKFWMERGAKFCDTMNPALIYDLVRMCAGGSIQTGHRNIGRTVTDKKTMRIIALDPALTGDRYALALGHLGRKDTVVIDMIRYWSGSQQKQVDITEVENEIRDLCKRFYVRYVVLDKYQSASTIQRLRKEGIPIYSLPPRGISAPKFNQLSYEYMIDRINLQKIHIPWHATLLNEFQFLQRKVSGKNVRYEAAVGNHDDGTDAVSRVVMVLEMFGKRKIHIGFGSK